MQQSMSYHRVSASHHPSAWTMVLFYCFRAILQFLWRLSWPYRRMWLHTARRWQSRGWMYQDSRILWAQIPCSPCPRPPPRFLACPPHQMLPSRGARRFWDTAFTPCPGLSQDWVLLASHETSLGCNIWVDLWATEPLLWPGAGLSWPQRSAQGALQGRASGHMAFLPPHLAAASWSFSGEFPCLHQSLGLWPAKHKHKTPISSVRLSLGMVHLYLWGFHMDKIQAWDCWTNYVLGSLRSYLRMKLT